LRQGDAIPVRYIDPDGLERSESFPDKRKREAQTFLAEVQANIHNGTYINPDTSRTTLRSYASSFLAASTANVSTRERLEREFRLHVFPTLGALPLSAVQPSTIRAWGHRLQEAGLSTGYQRILFNDLSTIFNAAVDDRMILKSPFAVRTVRAPRSAATKVVPWSAAERAACRAALPARYRVAVDLGTGCGLRQGEMFAIGPGEVDDVRRVLHVVRQVKIVAGRLVFAPPKGGKIREVPLPDSVARRIDAHAQEYPPADVTLPWITPDGEAVTVTAYLANDGGEAISRTRFNESAWKPAIRAAGIADNRHNGMHVLRHTYASVLLDAGESIKALSLYLGHSDPGFTLRVYTHLLPTSEDRTRKAIDRAFDGLETA
jgi:integrase